MVKILIAFSVLSLMVGCTHAQKKIVHPDGLVEYITYDRLGSQGTIDLTTDGKDMSLKYGGVDIKPEDIAAALIKLLGGVQ